MGWDGPNGMGWPEWDGMARMGWDGMGACSTAKVKSVFSMLACLHFMGRQRLGRAH